MAVGDIYKFVVEGRYDLQQTISIFYYAVQAGSLTDSAADLRDAWVEDMKPAFRDCSASGFSILQYLISLVSPVQTNQVPYTDPGLHAGTQAGDGVPGTVAAVFSKYTAVVGRAGRGRHYHPAIAETDTTQGVLSLGGTTQARFAALAIALASPVRVGVSTNIYTPQLRHHAPGSGGTGAPIYDLILLSINQQVLGNQRRRRIGRGK